MSSLNFPPPPHLQPPPARPYRPIRPTSWLKRRLRGKDPVDIAWKVFAGVLIWSGITMACVVVKEMLRAALGLGR